YHSLLNTDLQSLTNEQLENDLYKGMQIKTKIVEKDEHEHNVRMYLNLGHTFGHALEAELGYGRITHGEAVALGLLFALRVSVEEFSQTLSLSDLLDWMQHNHYPLDLPTLQPKHLLRRMAMDKKASRHQIRMIL